jgi:DNA-binding NarL/FixJ family response regulator
MKAKRTRILIADDHAVVRLGLTSLFSTQKDMEVVAQAKNGEEAVRLAEEKKPDVVIMDLVMPRVDGAEATSRIRKSLPETKVVILTSFGSYDGVARAIAAGAAGAITKTTEDEQIVPMIRRIAAGEKVISSEIRKQLAESPSIPDLTERQTRILEALTRGLSNNDIAKMLNTTPENIRDHLKVVFAKIGAANRTEAVAIALKKHLLKT